MIDMKGLRGILAEAVFFLLLLGLRVGGPLESPEKNIRRNYKLLKLLNLLNNHHLLFLLITIHG